MCRMKDRSPSRTMNSRYNVAFFNNIKKEKVQYYKLMNDSRNGYLMMKTKRFCSSFADINFILCSNASLCTKEEYPHGFLDLATDSSTERRKFENRIRARVNHIEGRERGPVLC